MRETVILGGLLYAIEALSNLTNKEVNILQRSDEDYIRKILDTERSTPRALLYLETGLVPLKFKVMYRRIMFYHNIVTQKDESLIKHVVDAQKKSPTKDDWFGMVENNMKYLNLSMTSPEFKCMKRGGSQKYITVKS